MTEELEGFKQTKEKETIERLLKERQLKVKMEIEVEKVKTLKTEHEEELGKKDRAID